MEIYNFDPQTKAYTHSQPARVDPEATRQALGRRPDANPIYMLPANATFMPAPEVGPQQAAIFVGDDWMLVPDCRGETWYTEDGNAVLIQIPGDPTGFTPPLSPIRRATWRDIQMTARRALDSTTDLVLEYLERSDEVPLPLRRYREELRDILRTENGDPKTTKFPLPLDF